MNRQQSISSAMRYCYLLDPYAESSSRCKVACPKLAPHPANLLSQLTQTDWQPPNNSLRKCVNRNTFTLRDSELDYLDDNSNICTWMRLVIFWQVSSRAGTHIHMLATFHAAPTASFVTKVVISRGANIHPMIPLSRISEREVIMKK